MDRMSHMSITLQNGQFLFEIGGFTASVVNHCFSYSDNKNLAAPWPQRDTPATSTSFELAVFDSTGKFVRLTEYDDVAGHIPVGKLPSILLALAAGDIEKIKEIVQ